MKTILLFISAVAMLLAATSCSSVKATPEAIATITKQVEGKDFTIDVRMANPLRGKIILLTGNYELTVKRDSAYAYLPYFGVAQWAPYGSTDGGIKFNEPMRDYTIKPNKKRNGWDISFKVGAKEYSHEIFLSIFSNGNASFTVTSPNRDAISFTGEVKR